MKDRRVSTIRPSELAVAAALFAFALTASAAIDGRSWLPRRRISMATDASTWR